MNSMKRVIFTAVAIVLIAVCFIWIIVSNGTSKGGKNMVSDQVGFEGQEIKSMDLKLGACEVQIKEGSSFGLEYENLQESKFHYSVDNGVLTVKYEGNTSVGIKFLSFNISTKNADPTITLIIPANKEFESVSMEFGAAEVKVENIMAEELKLTVGAGDMILDKLFVTKKAKIKVGAGEIQVKNAELANADLECGVGELDLEGKITGDSKLKCGVGEIDLVIRDAVQEDYYGDLKCGLGQLTFGDISISGSGKKSYGSEGANRLDAECGVGEVNVKFR